jgi:hypothetical protein
MSEQKLGNCRTPHFLGEPTPDRKALTQIPHHELPDGLCKEWGELGDGEPSPPPKKWYQCRGCGESYAVGVLCDLCDVTAQFPIIRQALISANEWAAKFPLSETDSKPDYNAAAVVYVRTSEALTVLGESGAAQEVSPASPKR